MKCPFCKDLTIAAVIQFFWRSDEAATLISLGEVAKKYLEHVVYTNQPIKKLCKPLEIKTPALQFIFKFFRYLTFPVCVNFCQKVAFVFPKKW